MRIVSCVVAVLLVCVSPSAQETVLPWPSVPNPGARSLGLGGAFAAQADDATAAFANPAGLVQLLRPEISGEFRLWGDDDEAGDGVVDDLTGVSFFSFVYPRSRWAVAVYHHQLARFDLSEADVGAVSSAEVQSTGVSAAYRVTDRLHLGFGVTYHQGELSSEEIDLGKDVGASAGMVWRPHRMWQVGGFYRMGPSLGEGEDSLELPDVAGVGCAFRSDGGRLLIAGELDRVMSDGLSADAHEVHLGAEWAILGSPVFALRAGTWRALDDDRPGGDELHWAGGFGLAFERFQLDTAIDVSDPVWTFSISAIVGF